MYDAPGREYEDFNSVNGGKNKDFYDIIVIVVIRRQQWK